MEVETQNMTRCRCADRSMIVFRLQIVLALWCWVVELLEDVLLHHSPSLPRHVQRGEKLNEMEQKFSELNSASGDFLKAVREYNERQARKKWWEF